MADLTMCEGYDCPLKNICHRYLAVRHEHRQAWFSEDPRGTKEDRSRSFKRKSAKMCYYFWEDKTHDKGIE